MKKFEEFETLDDKFAVFDTLQSLTTYAETIDDFIKLFSYITDNQKLEVMKKDYFKEQTLTLKRRAIYNIRDEDSLIKVLQDASISEGVIDSFIFEKILLSMDENRKVKIINKPELLKKYNITGLSIIRIFTSISDEKIQQIISDTKLMEKLEVKSFYMVQIVARMKDDNIKYNLMKNYNFDRFEKNQIIKSFSYEYKKKALNNESYLGKLDISNIIASFSIEEKIDFFANNSGFLKKKDISIYDIVKLMEVQQQLEFFENMDKIELTEQEKRKIIAGLKNETKEKIEIEKVDEEYKVLLNLKLENKRDNYRDSMALNKIIPDFTISDLSFYKDLDELLYVNPIALLEEQIDIQKILELCKICPNLKLSDDLGLVDSTVEEFIEGEKWIQSVLNNISPEWTDVQKMAYIDTQIGKKISYTPEQGTEAENQGDSRALWRIISSGYGVCNGISQIEKYIFKRIGIESELVSSKRHAYLLVKDVEILTENGIKKGNTLIDPTWNLATSRFDAKPQHFCKSYTELRKADIGDNGKDYESHKNDDLDNIETIEMEESFLREVYKSIGLTDKNGNFPITRVIEQARKIDETTVNVQDNINKKFKLLQENCPEFAKCINSTIKIMQDVLFENNDNFEFKNAIASRVYDKNDEDKKAVLFLYINFEDKGKMFYYADKEKGEFVELSQQEFEDRFECYETDKVRAGNKKLWESEYDIEEKKENSSGKIVEGEGREI